MRKLALLTLAVLVCLWLAGCSFGASGDSGPCSAQNLKMGSATFCASTISIPKGGTITFTDDPGNGAIHILVIGTNGVKQSENGAPDFGGAAGISLNPGDTWTTPPWNTPGTYHITCTVHPGMNLTVTVTS